MAEKTEGIKSQLGSLGGRYWIFALIGSIMVVATTYEPYFLAYSTTALVVAFCALVWCLWRNAPSIAKYGMALITLGAFVFMLYNSLAVLYGWSSYIHHPSEADALMYGSQIYMGLFTNDVANITAGVGGLSESTTVSALAYGMGGIGSLLFLVSGLMGIMAARRD